MSGEVGNSEIKTFKDFLDKINLLPNNPKYSSFNSAGGSVPNQNTSTPIKGANINSPPSKPTNLTLTLKPIRGDSQQLRLPFSQSVGELRAKVAKLFQISEVDRCRLIRGGKALSDDTQNLESVFGVISDNQILHVLEKPATAPASPSEPVDALKAANHKIWHQIEKLLQSEAGVTDEKDRSSIIEKFRKSLN